MRRIHIEFVGYDRMVDSMHVDVGPSKDVLVFSEETDELVPEASRQLRSDLDSALWVLIVQLNGFQLIDKSASFFLLPFSRIKFS